MIVLAVIGAGYWSLIIGTIVGSWTGAMVALKACPYHLALRFDRTAFRSYVAFSAPLLVSFAAVLALFQVIFFVGNATLGLAGLGAFTLVGNIVQFTDQADSIVTETLYPAVCAVKDRVSLLAEVFVKSNRLSLMWAVPFGVGMTLFGPDLVHFVLSARWSAAVPLLQIMGVVTAVHHVGYNWGAFVKARGTTWPIAAATVVGCAATIGAAVALMYSDGIVGLGWAFAIGEAVNLVTRGLVIARMFRRPIILTQLLRGFAPTLVAAAPVLALQGLTGPGHSLLAAVGVLVLYVTVTALTTIVFERTLLREALSYLRHPADRRVSLDWAL
jgi:O-antigen/teichoic acid export membrane protein